VRGQVCRTVWRKSPPPHYDHGDPPSRGTHMAPGVLLTKEDEAKRTS